MYACVTSAHTEKSILTNLLRAFIYSQKKYPQMILASSQGLSSFLHCSRSSKCHNSHRSIVPPLLKVYKLALLTSKPSRENFGHADCHLLSHLLLPFPSHKVPSLDSGFYLDSSCYGTILLLPGYLPLTQHIPFS